MEDKSLRVYLDYNVLVSLQEGKISVTDIKNKIGTPHFNFVYSASHIEEVRNITSSERINKNQAIRERLLFIDQLTKRQYLERISFDKHYKKRSLSAFSVYENLEAMPGSNALYTPIVNQIDENQKRQYRELLGLSSKELNNKKPVDIICHLNTRLHTIHKMSFAEMIQHARTLYPTDWTVGIETDITSAFFFLDLLGYWKDEPTDRSNVARLWDSSHCAFASFCDILISHDKRMCIKSEVAYLVYQIPKRIIHVPTPKEIQNTSI